MGSTPLGVPWKVLAIILWTWTPLFWQPSWGQAPGIRVQPGSDKKQQTKLGTTKPQADQRGTQDSPLIVETHNRHKTNQEADEEKKATKRKEYIDTWTLRLAFAVAGFTGLLVIIGGLGVWAALRTLRAIEAQGKHMERQADLLERQVEDAKGTTKILERSVSVAEENAQAAKESAMAAKLGVEAMVDKERARIRIKPGKVIIDDAGHPINEVKYRTFCFGTTPAFVRDAIAGTDVNASLEPPMTIVIPPISLEPVWLPDHTGTEHTALIFGNVNASEINDGKKFIYFSGQIQYSDVFGRERETFFRYRWRATSLKNFDGTAFCMWEKCGSDSDNRET